jgi:tRNA(Arg) A34 adenosine deaminase TadA
VRRFTALIPPSDSDRKTRIEYFRERFSLYREFIWPELRKLVEKDLSNESENQLLQEMFEKRKALTAKQKELKSAQSRGDSERAEELEDEIEALKRELREYKELSEAAQRELMKAFEKVLREAAERMKKQLDDARQALDEATKQESDLGRKLAEIEKAAAEGVMNLARVELVPVGGPVAVEQADAVPEALVKAREGFLKAFDERARGATAYVTLEPCAMCAGAISHARVSRLVYGAQDAKGGAVDSGVQFFDQPSCHWRPEVVGGVMGEDSAALLKAFFRARRG